VLHKLGETLVAGVGVDPPSLHLTDNGDDLSMSGPGELNKNSSRSFLEGT